MQEDENLKFLLPEDRNRILLASIRNLYDEDLDIAAHEVEKQTKLYLNLEHVSYMCLNDEELKDLYDYVHAFISWDGGPQSRQVLFHICRIRFTEYIRRGKTKKCSELMLKDMYPLRNHKIFDQYSSILADTPSQREKIYGHYDIKVARQELERVMMLLIPKIVGEEKTKFKEAGMVLYDIRWTDEGRSKKRRRSSTAARVEEEKMCKCGRRLKEREMDLHLQSTHHRKRVDALNNKRVTWMKRQLIRNPLWVPDESETNGKEEEDP
ncbi:hypothetical protein PROFUN_01781 [Planoprotostelium fungivorum]|uniref:Uncharacterized protein n=1 Tax=Planoprotostelium fungivorum TaxID=1890364 RepID=A0A2P6MWJ1_9EUKA|nr:hypothetical protein PROFUN_01781 [Planoprotostelium fungivorum]